MTSIHNLSQKIKGFIGERRHQIITSVIIVFVGIFSFFLGKVSQNELDNENIYIVNIEDYGKGSKLENSSNPISISSYSKEPSSNSLVYGSVPPSNSQPQNARYVASSRGKLYYRIGCGGSTKLVEQNKIFFDTSAQAENMGYKPATNCAP